MAVELTQQKQVVRYYPLVGYCLLNLLTILTHVYLAYMTALFWLSAAILGVAVISLFRGLQKLLGEDFGALLVDHAG